MDYAISSQLEAAGGRQGHGLSCPLRIETGSNALAEKEREIIISHPDRDSDAESARQRLFLLLLLSSATTLRRQLMDQVYIWVTSSEIVVLCIFSAPPSYPIRLRGARAAQTAAEEENCFTPWQTIYNVRVPVDYQ